MRKLWLSFADPVLPEGHQFLGVVVYPITDADAEAIKDGPTDNVLIREIISDLYRRGINPGGEIQFTLLPASDSVPDDMVLKLLSKKELEEVGLI